MKIIFQTSRLFRIVVIQQTYCSAIIFEKLTLEAKVISSPILDLTLFKLNRDFKVALVDLGGRAGHLPPPMGPILSFLHTFSPKSACIGGPHPPNGCTPPPLREILDPPLGGEIKHF